MAIIKSLKKTGMVLSFLLYIIIFASPTRGDAADLYAIIIGDTRDADLGPSVVLDVAMMQDEVKRIGSYTFLNVKEIVLTGNEAIAANVNDVIKNLSVNSDDVVLFYFSGHGYRTKGKWANPWPNLYFSTEDTGMDLAIITNSLAEKKPRLIVAIADCCNNVIKDNEAPTLIPVKPKGLIEQKVVLNYKKLFLEMSGMIIVSGSIPGEYSYSGDYGSFFTIAFLQSMAKEVRKQGGKAGWAELLDRASSEVDDYQEPQYLYVPFK